MKIAYEIKEGGAVIWRCRDYGSEAELPDMIEGCPVTELAPYAFSLHMDERLLEKGFQEKRLKLWTHGETETEGGTEEPPVLAGAELTVVSLPASLQKIGAYAFYNCSRLGKIRFYGRLSDLGAGLFTGCHAVRELTLRLDEEETSCLREILIEVPEKLTVFLEGKLRAKLVFPEFFEESVENTPARILVIHTHGSGMNYRNCFYSRKFDFRAYDACFYRARAEEDFETVLEMALGRLRYPVGLLPENQKIYEEWLRAHRESAMKKTVADRDMDSLECLTETLLRELLGQDAAGAGKAAGADAAGTGEAAEAETKIQIQKVLEEGAALAASRDFPEGVSFLMERLWQLRRLNEGREIKKTRRFEL